MYFDIGATLVTRGYNVLIFDGPGQGYTARFLKVRWGDRWQQWCIPPRVSYHGCANACL